MKTDRIHSQRLLSFVLAPAFALGLLLALSGAALAVEMPSVYTAEVAYDDSARDGRDSAYALALGDVLRRITPDASRAEAAALFDDPADFVLGWREGVAGRLWVSFDGLALSAVLRNAGVPVWGSDRPLTMVWLAVEGLDGERRILNSRDALNPPPTANDVVPPMADRQLPPPFDFYAAIEQAANARGIPLRLPMYDGRDQASVTDSDIWGGFDEVLLAASRRYGADSVLIGRASERQPQRIRWTWLFAGETSTLTGSVAAAANRVSQSLIGQFASSPDASLDVRMSVIGVEGMNGYARLLNYLRGQSLIEDVRVVAMRSDQLLLEIDALVSRSRIAQMLDGDVLSAIERPMSPSLRPFGDLDRALPDEELVAILPAPIEPIGAGLTAAPGAPVDVLNMAPQFDPPPRFDDADLYFRMTTVQALE